MTQDRGTKERSLKLSSGEFEHSFGARPDGEGGGWLVFEVYKAHLVAIKRFREWKFSLSDGSKFKRVVFAMPNYRAFNFDIGTRSESVTLCTATPLPATRLFRFDS
jgi:hypothetical protein